MPSWNVHTAHVQRLLHEGSPRSLGVRDANAFLFGNFLPDTYVGYMVPSPSRLELYTFTHVAESAPIPVPRAQEFWDTYVEPVDPASALPADMPNRDLAVSRLTSPSYRANDVTLGCWAHILCDGLYNSATKAWIADRGVPTGERTRIRKQTDFLYFGETLPITLECEVTPELLAQCRDFVQYPVLEDEVRRSVAVARCIVEDNRRNHIEGTPDYSLFTEDCFHEVFEHVTERLYGQLRAYAGRLDARGA